MGKLLYFQDKDDFLLVLPGPRLHYSDLLKHGGQQLTFIRPWGITKLRLPCLPLKRRVSPLSQASLARLPVYGSLLCSEISLLLDRDARPGDVALNKVLLVKDSCPELSLSKDCPLLRYEAESRQCKQNTLDCLESYFYHLQEMWYSLFRPSSICQGAP